MYMAIVIHEDYEDQVSFYTRTDEGTVYVSTEYIQRGNSDKLNLGDDIFILGYPGIGGNTLTLTRGVVSGFTDDNSYIKTDAEINSGNSGGIALNCKFEIIGITTAAATTVGQGLGGKLGLITPINKALTLINYYNRAVGK